jgi:hypothetical protein
LVALIAATLMTARPIVVQLRINWVRMFTAFSV